MVFHEAIVIKHLPGKGKNAMGSLLAKDKQEREFKIGTDFSDKEKQHPPKIGSIITYRCIGFTKTGLSKFPSFMRIRTHTKTL